MNLILSKLSLVAVISLWLLGICACDGGIHVKGHVYVQKTSSGDSQAFIDQPAPSVVDLTPIKDAKVTLYHAGDFSPDSAKNSELRQASTLTDAGGSFDINQLTSPFRFNAGLMVEKEGYKPLTKAFYHDKIDHEVTIILVPDASNAAVRK
jgi:hypothetical protein